MSMIKLVRKIISPLIFLNIVKGYQGGSSLVKIKAAQSYVRGVEKVRFLFLGILFAMFSFVLLGGGLFLIHMALLTYSPWSPQVKFVTTLVLGGVEFLGGILILSYLLRERTWIKFWGIQKVLDLVVKDKSDNKR